MGILTNLLLSGIHFGLVCIDLAFVMVALRLFHRRWPDVGWLAGLDAVVRPAVDTLFNAVDQPWVRLGTKPLNQETKAALCLAGALAARILLIGIGTSLTS